MSWTPYTVILSEHLGLPIDFSVRTSAAFHVGTRQFFLQWAEETQSFLFYREIGHLVPHIGGELAKDLLAANFLLAETAGAALSYEKNDNMVGINKLQPIAGVTPQNFLVQLNDFFTLAEVWEGQLAERSRIHERGDPNSLTGAPADSDAQIAAKGLPAFLKV